MKRLLMGVAAALVLAVGAQAEAQQRAGVVTTLEGSVTVMRASLSEPAPLKFRDDIFVKDRIATAADSVARILLGGRAVVTVREHSVVTITEAPGLSTVDVVAGRAAVAVAREKMRAGDLIEVKTPNAVAGIRGTVIVAEVVDTDHSVITVLKGIIDVKRLAAGRAVGSPTVVRALERVVVAGGRPVTAPQSVSGDDARHLGQQFRLTPPRPAASPVAAAINEAEMERAVRHMAAVSALSKSHGRERSHDDDDDDDVRQAKRRRDDLDRDADENADRARRMLRKDRAGRDGHDTDRESKSDPITTVKGRVPATPTAAVLDTVKSYSNRGKGKYRDRD